MNTHEHHTHEHTGTPLRRPALSQEPWGRGDPAGAGGAPNAGAKGPAVRPHRPPAHLPTHRSGWLSGGRPAGHRRVGGIGGVGRLPKAPEDVPGAEVEGAEAVVGRGVAGGSRRPEETHGAGRVARQARLAVEQHDLRGCRGLVAWCAGVSKRARAHVGPWF